MQFALRIVYFFPLPLIWILATQPSTFDLYPMKSICTRWISGKSDKSPVWPFGKVKTDSFGWLLAAQNCSFWSLKLETGMQSKMQDSFYSHLGVFNVFLFCVGRNVRFWNRLLFVNFLKMLKIPKMNPQHRVVILKKKWNLLLWNHLIMLAAAVRGVRYCDMQTIRRC